MLSLERRYAKVVRSYARLKELYDKSLRQRTLLVDEIRDLRAEVRDLQRDARERDRASIKTMDRLFASTMYAISHLHDAGDLDAAERLSEWLDVMRENMLPVADVRQLIALLEEWCAAMPCDDPDKVAGIYLRTKQAIDDLTGTEG